ncbi:maturase [Escherichia coli]|uniref:maturase n=1 Tax=Escherichia coli TaxID=562 RepID=UPI0017D954F9|nr:maturase [Escherichia coli]EEW7849157.1 hypothetical protein [Escherichia coli]EFH1069704.1 hypothetical protein [Escherichia coli]EFO3674806.1 hypothetical protein [Escherichia coli]EHS9967573.1 maturase [Escherichia coli]EIH1753568.1 maturase [Escherichia coli]
MQQKTQCDPDESRRGEAPNPASSGAETAQTQPEREKPSSGDSLMEAILSQGNLKQALKRVKANKGAPGVDGINVSELPEHLKRQWPEIRSNLLAGKYQPQPVRRVDIPKPGGGTRQLGIPTVTDRFIQQEVKRAKTYVEEGRHWVVDIDLEKFFDRVCQRHDV